MTDRQRPAPHPGPAPGRRAAPAARLAACALLSLLALPGLGGCREPEERGKVLRVATTQQGERLRAPFRRAFRDFERRHPGLRVQLIEMDDDVYQKMGLLTLFMGKTPPDVYFQWGGYLVRRYAAAGYALDLEDAFPGAERARYLPGVWASCTGDDGRLYLWPDSASVTTVIWYRRSLFRRAGVEPPRTWEELLRVCDRLKARGIIPIAIGNRELWPGGNFAAYVAAQRAGVARYNRVLGLEGGTRLDDPELAAGLALLAELQARGHLNRGVNGTGTDDARSLLARGAAAMHPIGDWLVSEADPEESADLDAFRLPRLPGQRGDPSTLLTLATGYMVSRTTRHPAEAKALLRHLTSDAVQREWTRHGHLSAVRAAAPGAEAPLGQRRLLRFLRETRAAALAPDVGFNLEVSDAFLDAVSLVLGGRAAPAEALAGAERQVAALRRERQAATPAFFRRPAASGQALRSAARRAGPP